MKRFLLTLAILGLLLVPVNRIVSADDFGDLEDQKEQVEEEKGAKEAEVEEVEEETGSLNEQLVGYGRQLSAVSSQLSAVSSQLEEKKREIKELETKKSEREEELEKREQARASLIRDLYKRGQATSLELLLGSGGFSQFAQKVMLYQVAIAEVKRQAEEISGQVRELRDKLQVVSSREEELKNEVATLNQQQRNLETRKKSASGRISELTAYKSELLNKIGRLSEEIANITAQQEELIREKLAATAEFTSIGDTEPAISALPEPPFSPAFAAFSRGYPHRVGMNQYGAYGRSKAGQSADEILRTYYRDVDVVDYDCPGTIKISTGGGVREINFEGDYLKGIAEMPSSWGDSGGFEALKAQAIAARTYALAYTGGGASPICISQRCQVYRESKVNDERAANWHRAVEETRGKVITHGGSPIKAWYSSTDGGFTRLPTDFDVKWNYSPPYIQRLKDYDGDGNAYDGSHWGASPWFYKAWYDSDFDEHPWLAEEEMEDLLNASLLPESYNEHLSQEDPVVSSEPGWSKEEVREALGREGIEPVGDIRAIQTIDSEEGYTQILRVISDNYPDGKNVDGWRFREIFMLRSRGHLVLWSSLYDVVRH